MPTEATQATHTAVISHWSTLIEDFQVSPLAFYTAVEEALARRRIPETKNSRVDFKETGLLSAKREYLRVTREKLIFDICAAPFGTGFFVSYWQVDEPPYLNPLLKVVAVTGMLMSLAFSMNTIGFFTGPIILAFLTFFALAFVSLMAGDGDLDDYYVRALPLIGTIYMRLFRQGTYYRIDTMQMYQKAVHNAVVEVIGAMTAEKGVRASVEEDSKPVMRDFYASKSMA